MRLRLIFRWSQVRSSGPAKHSFIEIGPEISTAIPSLSLIQVGQWLVTGELVAVARSDARLPGMRTVSGSILTSGNILSWRLVMK